ncbi:hypothetical protein V6N13_039954 [Hibiscus sabdariffa]
MVDLVASSSKSLVGGFELVEFPPLHGIDSVAGNGFVEVGVGDVEIQSGGEAPCVPNVDSQLGSGSVEIRFLAPSVYMINFPSQRVRDWVLESGPWHIQQKVIVLRKWMHGLSFEELKLDSAPVWVKLWHVPLELFSQKGLSYIASAIGKPLYSDSSTAMKQQLEFVKICIEVAANDDIPSSVLIELGDGNMVPVTVEIVWSPPKCKHCSIFGHSGDKCKEVGNVLVQENVNVQSGIVEGPVKQSVGNETVMIETVVQGNVDVHADIVERDVGRGVDNVENVMVETIPMGIETVMVQWNANVQANLVEGDVVQDASISDSGNKADSLAVLPSSNKFVLLHVEGEADDKIDDVSLVVLESPRKGRLAAEGVAELMQQLKPKAKEQKRKVK